MQTTFYWLALLNPSDAFHVKALGFDLSASLIVTTSAVQVEVMDALCGSRTRSLAVRFWEESINDPGVLSIPVDISLMHRGASLYSSRSDKDWSMTDCLSFVVMKDRGIGTAHTGDRHFLQAGFQCAFP